MRRVFFSNRSFKFLLGGLVFLFVLLIIQKAYVQPPPPPTPIYTISAHGNTGYGVNRTGLSSFNYSIGNCAHCHEQHASIAGDEPAPDTGDAAGPDKFCLLALNFDTSVTVKPYAQSDSVCFYCHIVTGTYQSSVFYNYTYSITFGGNPDTTPNNIFDTFNSTSYHNLYDIWRLITGLKGTKTFTSFPADSNPCSGCHNVHVAKRSCGKPTGSYDPTKSAISKPSDHNNLWGDDTSERLNSNFTTTYQAPYWYGTTNYEPNNSTTYDGTNLPDYVTFCTNCHTSTANSVWSTTLNRWLKPIDWNVEKHGKGNADGYVSMNNPYPSGSIATVGNKVLACTDCHEPHGAPNVTLIRKEVNGGALCTISTIAQTDCSFPYDTNNEIAYLCDRCHKDDYEFNTSCDENRYYYIHHHSDSGDPFYTGGMCSNCHSGSGSGCTSSRNTQNCNCCHYHGSTYTRSSTTWRTF